MTAKIVLSFLYGVFMASMIWGTIVFPATDANSPSVVFPIFMTFGIIAFIILFIIWALKHWDDK